MEEKLHIENFGPISSADIEFGKFTVFTGNQGTGKSTVAKLYALFSWLEKSLARRRLAIEDVQHKFKFQNEYSAFFCLEHYFKTETELVFEGRNYKFHYKAHDLSVEEVESNAVFSVAKLMYVPAERNVLSSVERPSLLKGLGKPLDEFREEFVYAKVAFKEGYNLPFDNIEFEYDKENDYSWLKKDRSRVPLSSSSSGYQTVVPLLMVSERLASVVDASTVDAGLDATDQKKIQQEVEHIMAMQGVSEDVKTAMLKSLSKRYSYSRFVNIVEEPELNLFPSSQKAVLYRLIALAHGGDNKLLLTTHSPYMVDFITLSVKAAELYSRTDRENLRARISSIVPQNSAVDMADLKIYEFDGGFCQLLESEGIPSDDNFLNYQLMQSNADFDTLLEVEEDLENE